MDATQWAQAGIVFLGAVHAVAAYAYFSRSRGALPWALSWIAAAGLAAWALPRSPAAVTPAFAAAVALWTLWWLTLRAASQRDWLAEYARQATGTIAGSAVVLRGVRNFAWRGERGYDARWDEEVVCDLEAIEAVDLFVSTWGDPRIAHLIVSFVFRDAPPLAFSIETRREAHESWGGLAGFFRAFELIIIAARETDVIRVRTTLRRETVRRFRLRTTPAMRRKLFVRYVREMNLLAKRPRFYHTLFANCTTEVARIIRASGRRVPWAWPIVMSGHVPRYFHQRNLIDRSRPFADIEAEADVGERARDESSPLEFSLRIRT